MKNLIVFVLLLFSVESIGQNKYSHIDFNKLIEIKGTEYVIASIENRGKQRNDKGENLLFVNTETGGTKKVEFTNGSYIHQIEQVKLDRLGINKIIVEAQTVDLDGKKGISWNDPKQMIIITIDGEEKTTLTENQFFTETWTVNEQTGTIVVTGHLDSNNNLKHDEKDKSEIRIYNLKTLKLLTKIE